MANNNNTNNKKSKTQQKIQKQYDLHRTYKDMSARTGIDNKRLGKIRKGITKPTRSEVSKITHFKVFEPKKIPGNEVSSKDIATSTGFMVSTVETVLKAGKPRVTKKYLNEDNSYKLKTKENINYVFEAVVYVNLHNEVGHVSASKRFDFKMLDTLPIYEEHRDLESGTLYAFTIYVFRLHQYTNFKSLIEKQIERILNVSTDDEESYEIGSLLDLIGYV